MNRFIYTIPVLLSALCLASNCPAAPPEKKNKPAKVNKLNRQAKGEKLPAFTPEREAAALTFVRLHHADLAKVLSRLKESQQAEYELAIRELFHTSERLADLKVRDPASYELTLEAWKLKSRGELLAARLQHSSEPALEQELRDVLAKQIELQKRQQQLEIGRLKMRLEKLEADAARLDKDQQKLVDGRFRQLTQGRKNRAAKIESPAATSADAEQ